MLDVNKKLIDEFSKLTDEEKVARANQMTIEEIEVLHEYAGYEIEVNNGRITGVILGKD